jgi:hypothetical protein
MPQPAGFLKQFGTGWHETTIGEDHHAIQQCTDQDNHQPRNMEIPRKHRQGHQDRAHVDQVAVVEDKGCFAQQRGEDEHLDKDGQHQNR